MNKVIKYGDNVDTDVIIPARYLNTTDRKELASHAMEDIDADFHQKITAGDIIVAGKNFGCGSSREHAPIVIKESGIALIIAESFARIFYRNAINIGLAIIESAEAAREIEDGDVLSVDFTAGIITNESQDGKQYRVAPFPPFLQNIIRSGGLVELVSAGDLQ
ncbi:MAG: 3-isopropylmalate dehydratase small subunit [Oscillospiraceae bacterium]|jgi:3-isopropylmalate/(R)-2-methylmalate dehydratase small subunit|nr:3-isopropylmalate dehydratase small subunit [Oscillospiraceae bacterium]